MVGKKEGEGPLADSFDQINQDDSFGEKTWEKAETAMQKLALSSALDKAGPVSYTHLALLTLWGLTGIKSIFFHAYEDTILLLCGLYGAVPVSYTHLVIPHMVRILFGTDHKKLIPISALLGAIFLLWSDVLCRVVLPGKEIPIGVLTALVGAPVFIYLMARKKYGFGGGD